MDSLPKIKSLKTHPMRRKRTEKKEKRTEKKRKKNGKMTTGRKKKKEVNYLFNTLGFKFSPLKIIWYSFLGTFGYNYYLNLYTDLPEENIGKCK